MNYLDRLNLAVRYRRKFGRFPNLSHPTRFTEKIQLAKLTWRNPLMPILADKARVKEIVSSKLGDEWVTPNLFLGEKLPARQDRNWPVPYVIKATHRCGANIFVTVADDGSGLVSCRDEDGHDLFGGPRHELDWQSIDKLTRRWLARPYGRSIGEWAYLEIEPRLIVEPIIGNGAAPTDYKCMVFGGRVEFVQVIRNRFTGAVRSIYDRDWRLLPFTMLEPLCLEETPRPESLDEMMRAAEILAAGFPFARIDFYEIGGRPRFGEVTFYHQSGFGVFTPDEWDERLGALWPNGEPAESTELY
jgi:hypothetical protein